MSETNQTSVEHIVLIGFEGPLWIRYLMFLFLIFIYMFTLVGNSLIITLVSISPRLHSPMYFFLCHLSLTDIIVASDVIPNMMFFTLQGRGTISFPGCLTQLFFFGLAEDVESFLLTVMSYDRYLAICKPLHYASIMSLQFQSLLVTSCWMAGLMLALLVICQLSTLQFCGPDFINHFFCDLDPVLDLSCSDTFVVEMEVTVGGIPVIIFAFVFIIVTYVCIFRTVFGSPITAGRQKAFSTCTSHLSVVCTYYGTLIINYVIPMSGQTIDFAKYISVLYTVMTPLLNPIIYTLRNKDIRSTLMSIKKQKLNHF